MRSKASLKGLIPLAMLIVLSGYWGYFHLSPQVSPENRSAAVFSHRLQSDPEAPYALSSLSVFKGQDYVYVDHPGTPVQLIGTGIYALTYPYTALAGEDFFQFHLAHQWVFLVLARAFLLLTSLVCVWMLFHHALPLHTRSDYLAASAVAWSFYAFLPASLASLAYWSHNSFAFPFGTLLLLIMGATVQKRAHLTWSTFGMLGFAAGILTAIQIYFATWVIGLIVTAVSIAILEKHGLRRTVAAIVVPGLASLAGFGIATLPIIQHYGGFFRWIRALILHQGRYGSGASGVISGEALSSHISEVFSSYRFLSVATTLLILFVILLMVLNRKTFSQKPPLWATLFGLLIQMIVTILAILKHPGGNYMVAIAALWPMLLASSFLALNLSDPVQGRLRVLLSIAVLLASVYTLSRAVTGHDQYLRYIDTQFASADRFISEYAERTGTTKEDVLVLLGYNSLSTRCYYLWFGNDYSARVFTPEIGRICPNELGYNIWSESVLRPEGATARLDDPGFRWDVLIVSEELYPHYALPFQGGTVAGDLRYFLNPLANLSLNFDQYTVNSTGWHMPEFADGGLSFQWMSETRATLPLSLQAGRNYRVSFTVFALETDVLESLALAVNGVEIDLNASPRSSHEYVFGGIIPQAAIDPPPAQTVLTFSIDRVSIPTELGINDTRPLGVAFDRLEIFPWTSDE